MYDTYWSGDEALHIELTDENIDEFEFVFDFDDVKAHSGENVLDYDESDRWHVALDSGGMYCGGKWFVRKDAIKNREKVLERLKEEIISKENSLEHTKLKYERVLNGECPLEYA